MPDVTTVTNWVDWYAPQLIRSKDWFKLRAPLWNNIDEITTGEVVSQRGVRFFFNKTP